MPVLISAIMPVFNGERWVAEAIQSIIDQTYHNWELIVVDDCSTDATSDILEQFQDERISVIRLDKNVGSSVARNIAIKRSQGSYIAICDSDDLSLPQRFATQLEYSSTSPEVGVWGSQMLYIRSHDGSIQEGIQFPSTRTAIHARLQRGRIGIPNPTAFIGRHVFERFGMYEPECRRCQDLELFLRIRNEVTFAMIDQPLVLYRETRNIRSIRRWCSEALYRRYAVYHANLDRSESALAFREFSSQWNTRAIVGSVDMIDYFVSRIKNHLWSRRRLV